MFDRATSGSLAAERMRLSAVLAGARVGDYLARHRGAQGRDMILHVIGLVGAHRDAMTNGFALGFQHGSRSVPFRRAACPCDHALACDGGGVAFKYKDYRVDGHARQKVMRLATDEFIRRFLIHVLPTGFHRIRHYGLFASGVRAHNIAHACELLAAPIPREQDKRSNDSKSTRAARPRASMPML
jgi:Putative transposase